MVQEDVVVVDHIVLLDVGQPGGEAAEEEPHQAGRQGPPLTARAILGFELEREARDDARAAGRDGRGVRHGPRGATR